jgi:hypothetical protein
VNLFGLSHFRPLAVGATAGQMRVRRSCGGEVRWRLCGTRYLGVLRWH